MNPSDLPQVLMKRAHLAGRVVKRRLGIAADGQSPVDRFHDLYYDSEIFRGTWWSTHWMGIPLLKCPFDLWVYQELLYRLRPDVIVETGTAWGGSALYLASLCDLLGRGRVISIDLVPRDPMPVHPRIRYIRSSSTDPGTVEQVREATAGADTVLVMLDSDHSCAHVLEELRLYSPLVPVNSYVIVEDTNLNGHPVMPDFGPGPMEAVDEFLAEDDGFVIDPGMEKFQMTMNPRGFLKRVR